MASDADASVEVELAWHLLTVLLRLGGPAAAAELAASSAAEVTPRQIERLCRVPGSPLRLSGGVVTASETAVVAFLRFAGCVQGVSVPRVSLRAPEVRRWFRKVPIKYERKRKASDAGCFVAKRRLLVAPDSDFDEHRQQLIAQSCSPVATEEEQLIAQSYSAVPSEEAHMEVMQKLQDKLPILGRIVEPSIEFSTVGALVPSVPEISLPDLRHQIDQFVGGNDGSFPRKASTLMPNELSNIPCTDIPSLGTEKLENIRAADNEISQIGGPERALLFNDYIVEDSDLEKESTIHHMAVQSALVGESKNGIKEDLNLRHCSPINCYTRATANLERICVIPNQAESLKYVSPNAGYSVKAPTCQEMNSLGSHAYAGTHRTTENLFQSSTDTKAGPLEYDAIHAMMETFCQPSLGRKIESAALPVEATGYDCIQKRDLTISAENREGTYLNQGEQSRNEMCVNLSKKEQYRRIVKQREKNKKNDALPKEQKDQFAAKTEKLHGVPKPQPSFKNFVVEEEEGSGGYGTVYRARRKSDGKVFAIKCPHAKAHSHHVNNERKMLQRFGGNNYVIKFECSVKSDDLDCFVLEHVEHDRPENLKREIDVFGLQWYGYCLFKALASLHKQGIVHRDVKPGNFLFSRKMTKGYLIDFNLANDLHQKFKSCKSETMSSGKDTISHAALKSAPVVCAKEAIADSKQPPASKRKRSSNRSPVGCVGIPKIDSKNRHGSQAADVSGVTSAKDPTSTKTSLNRLKQPMPYKGRKELMNFLQETMQSPDQTTSTAPVSQRKRVAAPFGNVDRKLFVLTPMPLHSGGGAVAGSGMLNSKGHGKHRREGPCDGTKGFRAPEVLFRSFHQGCKVDVWSAGVTLLYLILGRTPFFGDPEQSIKEIAKLRGSEELWEVAKLHNCESAYPSELFDIKSLRSVDLRAWCAANTRRPKFLKLIPDSLFDLVDKCLAVNPRCRLTSEDALMHDFFADCHESLRERRTLRSSVNSDIACSSQGTLLTVKES